MSREIILTCDICGSTSPQEFHEGMKVLLGSSAYSVVDWQRIFGGDLCQTCLDGLTNELETAVSHFQFANQTPRTILEFAIKGDAE